MEAILSNPATSSRLTHALRDGVPHARAASDPLYARVMAWHFPPLVDRLVDKEAMSVDMATSVVADVKRFLYLCGTKEDGGPRLSPPEVIDIGWHAFLLFTREYQAFCDTHFGRFIHHVPFTRAQRAGMVRQGSERETVQNTIDRATDRFGVLTPNWYAVGYNKEGGILVMGCSDCAGSTNCGGNDPPCC